MAPTRKIGESVIHPIGYGAMGIAGGHGPIDSDEVRLALLDRAYELGVNHWDTAAVYGDSEELLGKWFKKTGKRDEIFLATKFGIEITGARRGDPEHVRESFNRSLKRLGVESIDLFYQHATDPKTPIEITIGAMAELVKEGKVKYLGVSECSVRDLRRAHAVHPISAIQVEFSPFELRIEDPKIDILRTARELGITIVCASPLGKGLLAGRFQSPSDFPENDIRKRVPKFSEANFPKIIDLGQRIKGVAASHNATAGQACLAWTLAQGEDFVVIPGTKKIKYLEENVGAAEISLTPEEVALIRKIAVETELPGERYAEAFKHVANAESPELPK